MTFISQFTEVIPRRALSNASSSKSSPTTSIASTMLPSPPATRLRSRKLSNEAATPSSSSKGKGKARHVEFEEQTRVVPSTPSSLDDESELSELTEIEDIQVPVTPSPRRLRSKDRTSGCKRSQEKEALDDEQTPQDIERRITPMRKAKRKVGCLKESDTEEEEDELEEAEVGECEEGEEEDGEGEGERE